MQCPDMSMWHRHTITTTKKKEKKDHEQTKLQNGLAMDTLTVVNSV